MKVSKYIKNGEYSDTFDFDSIVDINKLIKYLQWAKKNKATHLEISCGFEGEDITAKPFYEREETAAEKKDRENRIKNSRTYGGKNLIAAIKFLDQREVNPAIYTIK